VIWMVFSFFIKFILSSCKCNSSFLYHAVDCCWYLSNWRRHQAWYQKWCC
jgi:hypothetical protein